MTREYVRRRFGHCKARLSLKEEMERVEIVRGLIEMRKAGLISAVYCDGGKLGVAYETYQYPRRVRWSDARKLVEDFRKDQVDRWSN